MSWGPLPAFHAVCDLDRLSRWRLGSKEVNALSQSCTPLFLATTPSHRGALRPLPLIQLPPSHPLNTYPCAQKKQALRITVSDDDLISASKEGVAVVLLEGAGEPGC